MELIEKEAIEFGKAIKPHCIKAQPTGLWRRRRRLVGGDPVDIIAVSRVLDLHRFLRTAEFRKGKIFVMDGEVRKVFFNGVHKYYLWIPKEEDFAWMLFYTTGSLNFVRGFLKQMQRNTGRVVQNNTFYKEGKDGDLYDDRKPKTEEEIFDLAGITYRAPNNRESW